MTQIHIVEARWSNLATGRVPCVICNGPCETPVGPALFEGKDPVCDECGGKYNRSLLELLAWFYAEMHRVSSAAHLSDDEQNEIIHDHVSWLVHGPEMPEPFGVLDPHRIAEAAEHMNARVGGHEEPPIRPDWAKPVDSDMWTHVDPVDDQAANWCNGGAGYLANDGLTAEPVDGPRDVEDNGTCRNCSKSIILVPADPWAAPGVESKAF